MDREWRSNIVCLAITLLATWLVRASINIIRVPPMFVGFDQRDDLFLTEGRMQIKVCCLKTVKSKLFFW